MMSTSVYFRILLTCSCLTLLSACGELLDGVDLAPNGMDREDAVVTSDITATADTTIDEAYPTTNYGSSSPLRIGRNSSAEVFHGLVRVNDSVLDPATSPYNSTNISSATLTFTLTENYRYTRHVGIYRIVRGPLNTSNSWVEADATWNRRIAPRATWNAPIAASSYSDTKTISATASVGTTYSFNVTSDVQAIIAGNADNYGWILKVTDPLVAENVKFASREATAAQRPVLHVECTPTTQAQACTGIECGTVADGCGGTITCPDTCTGSDCCGGGGIANTCGQMTCASYGSNVCGNFPTGCVDSYGLPVLVGPCNCASGTCQPADAQLLEHIWVENPTVRSVTVGLDCEATCGTGGYGCDCSTQHPCTVQVNLRACDDFGHYRVACAADVAQLKAVFGDDLNTCYCQ